jgi:cobalt/nickel transport system permease protein
MTLAFAQPDSFPSPLSRLDPRWKLAALVLAALAVALLQTLLPAAIALAAAILLVLLARLPARWYLTRLATVALFLSPFVLFLPFLLRDAGPGWEVGPLWLSLHGLRVALLLTCKALAIVSLILVLLATAPLDATLKAAHSLHVPALLVQLTILTYRYLFLLADELGRLRIALRVRGYRHRANLHSYRTVAHVTGSLLVRSYERGERVGQAMRCRGFDGRFRSLVEFHTKARDVLVFALIVGSAAGLFFWDIFGR